MNETMPVTKAPRIPFVKDPEAALARFGAYTPDVEKLKRRLKAYVGESGISEFDLMRIKVPSGGARAFDLTSSEGKPISPPSIRVLILAHARGRGYWPKSFDETGGGTPPQCSSKDCITGYGDPGGSCARCPFAQFGSDTLPNGSRGKGQACKEVIRLFVLREDTDSRYPELLVIPPTSIRSYEAYAKIVVADADPPAVITEVSLTPQKNSAGVTYSHLEFRSIEQFPDGHLQQILDYAIGMAGLFIRTDKQPALEAGAQQPALEAGAPEPKREGAF